jgi:glycosyltransferase involved in cell wall biosynthesis
MSRRMMMITQIVDEDDANLAVTIKWIRSLAEKVEHLRVIALRTGRYNLPENVSVHSLKGNEDSSRPYKLFRLWSLVARHIAKTDYLFIHQGQIYTLLVAPIFRLLRKPVVFWKTYGYLPWTVELGLKFVDGVVTASERSFPMETAKKIVTGHGVDLEQFDPSGSSREPFSDETVRMATTGRVSPDKQIDRMIDLIEQGPAHWKLSIYGEPVRDDEIEYYRSLKERTSTEPLNQKIHWKGAVNYEEIPKEIEQIDLFLNFSKTRSVDKAVVEALALGRPVVTTNPAFEEIEALRDYPYFAGTPANDEIQSLIDDWTEFSDEERTQYGNRARYWVRKNHSLSQFTTNLINVFDELSR